jgi:hypothetical protein
VLTELQRAVAEIVSGLDEAQGFALAGGAALIARGDVERQTRDLDFFGLTGEAVDRLVPAAERALEAAGFAVERVQVNPGFARLLVAREDDRTELDLAADARLFPAEPGVPAPTLGGEELAVDKVLAIFGRAEARDFVDLLALEPRYGLEHLCELAAEKDRGFTPTIFAEMLGAFGRLRREEFELDDPGYERLVAQVERWRAATRELAHRLEIEHERDIDAGPEL